MEHSQHELLMKIDETCTWTFSCANSRRIRHIHTTKSRSLLVILARPHPWHADPENFRGGDLIFAHENCHLFATLISDMDK